MGVSEGSKLQQTKMSKKHHNKSKERDHLQSGSLKTLPYGTCIASFLCIFGISLLILGSTRGSACKMMVIDASSIGDDKKDGNLTKWCIYTGVIYVVTGVIACLSVGPFAIAMKNRCLCLGAIVYEIFGGICGKLLLFFMFWLSLVANLLGFFWIHMASLARQSQDSNEVDFEYGGRNYCAPEIWYLANFVVYSFFVVSVFLVIRLGANIFSFFRGDEDDIEYIELGSTVVKMPKRRYGVQRYGIP